MTEVQQIKHWHWPSAKLTWFPSDSGPDLFAPYRVSLVDLALRRDAVVGPGGDRWSWSVWEAELGPHHVHPCDHVWEGDSEEGARVEGVRGTLGPRLCERSEWIARALSQKGKLWG